MVFCQLKVIGIQAVEVFIVNQDELHWCSGLQERDCVCWKNGSHSDPGAGDLETFIHVVGFHDSLNCFYCCKVFRFDADLATPNVDNGVPNIYLSRLCSSSR